MRLSRKGILNPNYKGKNSGTKEYHAYYSKNHKDVSRKYVEWYRKKQYSLRDEAKNKPCMDCRNIFPPYVMHFDHRNASTKLFNVGAIVGRVSHEKLLIEIAKCDVVCANCHAQRTYKRRIQCGLSEKYPSS